MLGFTRCASTACFTQADSYIVGIPVCADHQEQLRGHFAPKRETLIDSSLEPLDIAAVKKLQSRQSGPRITSRRRLSPQQGAVAPDDADQLGAVYYVTFRGVTDRLKIGTTAQASRRFKTFSSQSGGMVRLLVAEPGSRDQEASRHRQFEHVRISGTEFFRYTGELVDHIASLRQQYPHYRSFTDVGHSYD